MISRMTLRAKLALGVGLILIPIVILLILMSNYFENTVATKMSTLIGDRAMTNATKIGAELFQETAGLKGPALQKKIREYIGTDKAITALVMLKPDKSILAGVGKGVDSKSLIQKLPELRNGLIHRVDNIVVAVVSVKPTQQTGLLGWLVLGESPEEHRVDSAWILPTALVAVMVCYGAVILAVFFIAGRTARPVVELAGAAKRLSNGELVPLDVESTGTREVVQLAEVINEATNTVQKQIQSIHSLTSNLVGISSELSDAMGSLSSSASEQAAAVAETASTVTQMENAAVNAAKNANQIAEAAEKTAETSIRGRQAVETTNHIILQIKDDSNEMSAKSKNLLTSVEEVGNIIGFVNGIAEQSKILAVNASIEAAKAGEYGAGFAVVAQEVRDLAQQSKEATLQTTDTLNSIQKAIENMVATAQRGEQRTEDGVKMIGNAGAIVNDLSEAIRENSEFAKVIAANVNQQTIGLTQIATAIDQINSTAVQNQSISRRVETSMQQLTTAVTRLSDFIEEWRSVKNNRRRSTEPPAKKK